MMPTAKLFDSWTRYGSNYSIEIKMNKGETYYKPGQASEGFGEPLGIELRAEMLSRVAIKYSGEGE